MMFEILMYLFESYFDAGMYPEPEQLSRKLSAAGFEGQEITEALDWLSALQRQNLGGYPECMERSSLRHYSDHELPYIGDEARRYLLFAEQQHLISAVEREMVIDRAVALKHENLSLDKLKLIMLMVLWNRHQELDPLLIEELLAQEHSGQLH